MTTPRDTEDEQARRVFLETAQEFIDEHADGFARVFGPRPAEVKPSEGRSE